MKKVQTKSAASELITPLRFCVFDLETTGGNQEHDQIIEIGLVIIEELKIVDQMSSLIRPTVKIPDFVQKLTSIRPRDLKKEPAIEEMIDQICEFMGDSILVAHNTSFDIPFFNSVLTRLGRPPLENPSICTNLMTKYLIPNLMNTNLNYMSKIFGIKHRKAHRALDDAMATAQLLINYLHIFIDKRITKLNHIYYPRNRYELDRINLSSDEYSANEVVRHIQKISVPHLISIKGEKGVILYALPCINGQDEQSTLFEQLTTLNWKIVSIRLFGTLLEGVIHFNTLFSKLTPLKRQEIVEHLYATHLPALEEKKRRQNENKLPQFIVVPHLVPEQYLIYPLQMLNNRSALTFRYPAHQKKLMQFIRSRSSRMGDSKKKNIELPVQLQDFIFNSIWKDKTSPQLLLFDGHLPLETPQKFHAKMEQLIKQGGLAYSYPREHI
ncbi:MAG: 3'-5' exonuclease [Bdellovibrionales bacterium]|jgi:DNA polymerase III subunit epsilon|nr:3'-5' exonuclease [Bdellovibrionales bacterium]MBT3525421.1 3'-5' exonuclease [Bdellovibrionales bacterium]MBT7766256.1 3'-5' exonuclease [Bdellovibrionales bacterium]